MHRFLKGCQPPPPKKAKGDEAIKPKKVEVRQFCDRWAKAFPWLEFKENTGLMYCVQCVEAKASGTSFVDGNFSLKLDTLKKHVKSRAHTNSEIIVKGKSKPVERSEAGQGLMRLHGRSSEKMGHLFRTAHALALKGRPYTDFVWQCQLDKMKGIEIGKSYQNDRYARKLTYYIAEVERKKQVLVKLKKSCILSFLIIWLPKRK